MQGRIVYAVIKSYYDKYRCVGQEMYGYSSTIKQCMKMIREYKNILKNRQEPFLLNEKTIHGIYNRQGLDVIGGKKRIEFRVRRIDIMIYN